METIIDTLTLPLNMHVFISVTLLTHGRHGMTTRTGPASLCRMTGLSACPFQRNIQAAQDILQAALAGTVSMLPPMKHGGESKSASSLKAYTKTAVSGAIQPILASVQTATALLAMTCPIASTLTAIILSVCMLTAGNCRIPAGLQALASLAASHCPFLRKSILSRMVSFSTRRA